MGKADLHAHTCHDGWGDGNQTVTELFQHVEDETDLDVFAITDHDSTDAARAALEIHRRGRYRFDFLPGVEVTNLAGHLLCYFPSGEVRDIPSLRPFWWTVRYAHACGAICIAAHPVYPPWLVTTIRRGLRLGQPLDGMEAINGGIGQGAQSRLDRITTNLVGQVALVGNSDAHHRIALGSVYTSFPGNSLHDFLVALERRDTRPEYAPNATARLEMPPAARRFTNRRSMTRPGWVRNLWREIRPVHDDRGR